MRRICFVKPFVTLGLLVSAETTAAATESAGAGLKGLSPQEREELFAKLNAPPKGYFRLLAGVGAGAGVRFNNPYRLATQLGATAESPSTTAPYTMLTFAAAFGSPDRLQHGAFASLSIALTGIDQAVLTPGYIMVYRGSNRFLGYARGGPAIILSPQTNVGGELAMGGAFFLTGSFGLSLDIAANVFYGASTWEKKYPTYPVFSATGGFIFDFEVLP